MSTILDALNKLEDEKAHADTIDDIDVYLDSDHVAIEILTTSLLGDSRFPARSILIVAGIAIFALILVGASVALSAMVLGPDRATVEPILSFSSAPSTPLTTDQSEGAAVREEETAPVGSVEAPTAREANPIALVRTGTPAPTAESPTVTPESVPAETPDAVTMLDVAAESAARREVLARRREELRLLAREEEVTAKAPVPSVTISEKKVEASTELVPSHDLPRLSTVVKRENGLETIMVN